MYFSLFYCIFVLKCVEGARILGIFSYPSYSHQGVFQPVWKELSLRGHDVTVITPIPLNDPSLTNLTEIDVSHVYNLPLVSHVQKSLYKDSSTLSTVNFLMELGLQVMESEIQHGPVQDLIKVNGTKYDLVICQYSHTFNLMVAFGARFEAPLVAIASLDVFLHSHDALGNPTHPVVSPDVMLNFAGSLSFFERIRSLLFNFWYRIFYYWYALPKSDKIVKKHFGSDMPYLGEIEKNISLMLVNMNPFINSIRPNVPNLIEINQMHIKAKKPLPKDIKEFLDSSPQGVIYFSLGSNVKSANLDNNLRQTIIEALRELPYNILWKWETDYLPDKPKNVMIKKWMPQQDILGHPNVKVFVMQGGLQSIEEAIINEVPIVGLPFITDQPSNIRKIEDLGFGLGIDVSTITKDQMKETITEVAENKKYKENIQKSKAILLDQPMKGVDKAIWWIEYVIRHKGARHLRSPAADMSFFEYFMVDVVIFLLSCVVFAIYCMLKFFVFVRRLFISVKKFKQS